MPQPPSESVPDASADQPGEELPAIELETILDRPPSRRKRRAQVGAALLVLLVVALVYWRASAPPPLTLPPPPLHPAAVLYIDSSVNFGTLSINGSTLPGTLPALYPAHTSAVTISLNAPPFQVVTCHLSLPAIQSANGPFSQGNCTAFPFFTTTEMVLNGVVAVPTIQLSIAVGPSDLPTDQQSQVNALLAQGLTVQQTLPVPAGSYIATGFHAPTAITSQRASVPLQASGSIAPVPQDGQTGSSCSGFICAQAIQAANSGSPRWAISVSLGLRWRFSDASGALVSDVTFQGATSAAQIGETITLSLFYNQGTGWAFSPTATPISTPVQVQDTYCAAGEAILANVVQTNGNYSVNVLNDQKAQGCSIQVFVNNAYQGTFLWRFGVLLAVDAPTHAAYPQLPLAPQAEVAALGA